MAEKCVKAMNSQPILSPPRAVVVPRVRVGIQSGHHHCPWAADDTAHTLQFYAPPES